MVCLEEGEVIMEMVMGFVVERVGGVDGIDEGCVKETRD